MNITMDLLHVVEQAHSLDRILEAATRVIAERLRVEGCFVFLLDEHRPRESPPQSARLEPMRREMPRILALSDARSVAAALREAQLA